MKFQKTDGYTIFKDLGLVLQHQTKNINFKTGKKLKEKIYKDKDYCNSFKFLIDVRGCNFDFNKNEIKKYVIFMKKNYELHGGGQVAILTEKPKQVVVATIIINTLEENGVHKKLFSTKEAAYKWLALDKKNYATVNSALEKHYLPFFIDHTL